MSAIGVGQLVRNTRTGRIGITTDDKRKRTPSIPVMYVRASYPVLAQLEDLEHLDVAEIEGTA